MPASCPLPPASCLPPPAPCLLLPRSLLATIQIGHEMRPVLAGGRNLARRDQAAAQEALLVFAIQEDDAHDQILYLSHQETDLGLDRALCRGEALPQQAMLAHFPQRFV